MTPPTSRTWLTASVAVALLALAACTSSPEAPPTASADPLPRGAEPVELDPGDFTAGSDHPYFPLEVGQQWRYRETGPDGTALTVLVTVTSQTRRMANGVEARVVRDTVTEDGRLIEDTLDWYAQDSDGNVWYLGEDTAEFEDGRISSREGSFEAGVDGALPGIIMPAHPRPGLAYRQEYYEGEAEDNGEVLALHQQVQVPAGHFDDALLTADTITIEPRVLEYKLYAPGVGVVTTLGISGGGGREDLVATRTVGPAAARRAATAPLGTPYRRGRRRP